MQGDRGFTLIEVLIYVATLGAIIIVLLTTVTFGRETWKELATESEQSYAVRMVSGFFYREINQIDKNKPITFANNGARGRRMTYYDKEYNLRRDLEVSVAHRLTWRQYVEGGTFGSYFLAEDTTYINFVMEDNLFTVTFIIRGKEYKLVMPWE